MQDLRQHDLFEAVRVADYLLEKDRLFARLTLDDEEYERQVVSWCRALQSVGAAEADVLHLHHLTPIHEAAARVAPGDLVLTADIPLAGRALAAGARCLDFRGGEFTADRIGDALATSDLMRYLRDLGEPAALRGPAALTPRDRSHFASKLDATLSRLARGNEPR